MLHMFWFGCLPSIFIFYPYSCVSLMCSVRCYETGGFVYYRIFILFFFFCVVAGFFWECDKYDRLAVAILYRNLLAWLNMVTIIIEIYCYECVARRQCGKWLAVCVCLLVFPMKNDENVFFLFWCLCDNNKNIFIQHFLWVLVASVCVCVSAGHDEYIFCRLKGESEKEMQ